MNTYILHYPNRAYRSINVDLPINDANLKAIAHDTGSTIYRQVSVTVPRKPEDIAKERAQVLTAQYANKSLKLKQPAVWAHQRDELIRALIAARIPRWGSIRVNVTKRGV